MFSTVYRVTQKDFDACGNISVEVRRGTVLLEYETGRCLWDGKFLQHVEVAVSCNCRRCPASLPQRCYHVHKNLRVSLYTVENINLVNLLGTKT
jgi:hypothetical protein